MARRSLEHGEEAFTLVKSCAGDPNGGHCLWM